ncbi:MAG: hypothetical protein HQL07_07930 [Nitrospirae bacterium]|nr:hypothetical protein [Magnetococcales bacterium]HAT50529.1 hypothetical protein [Alphaproteobacteria bacterium]
MDRSDLKYPVFLSASLPVHPFERPDKDPKYWESRQLLILREAIRELAVTVLPHGGLVFGGHPAVNPLILGVADRLDHDYSRKTGKKISSHQHRILVYQSRHFMKVLPHEIESFRHVVLTQAASKSRILFSVQEKESASDREASLLYMRYRMIGKQGAPWATEAFPQAGDLALERKERFGSDEFQAAFFLGGMNGVEQEFEIFRAFHPETPIFLLPTTGSASRFLFNRYRYLYSEEMAKELESATTFAALYDQLLWSSPSWQPDPPFFPKDLPGVALNEE